MYRLAILSLLIGLNGLFSLQAQRLVPRTFTPNGRVFDLDRKGDTLYAVGSFSYVGVETGGAGWFADSLPDVNFPVIDGEVRSVVPDGQGGWYVGGDFNLAGDVACDNLVHIFPGGAVDQNFLPNINNEVKALAIFNDTMMIGGRFTQVDAQARERLAAFSLNNGQLTSWDPGANNTVNSLTVVGGEVFVGGAFTSIGQRYQPAFARLDIQTGSLLATLSPPNGAVNGVTRHNDRLYVAGSFQGLSGRFTGKGAAFNGLDEEPLLQFPRFNGTVRAIKEDGNRGWYVGGDFSQVDGQAMPRLVHIFPNGRIDPNFQPSPGGSVYDLLIFNDTMMVAGSFQTMGGQTRRRLAAVNATTGALLPWNPDADNIVYSLATDSTYIFAGGSFTSIGGRQQIGLAVIDKQTGLSLQTPGPISGQVRTLAWNDTMMFAGGSFNGAIGYAASRLTLLTGSTLLPDPTFPAFGGRVNVSIPDGNGGWYVGGSFFRVNGITQRRLAHILPDSTIDPNFSFNINSTVLDLLRSGDTLFIAGNFRSIDGTARDRVAAIDLGADTLLNFSPTVSATVNTLKKLGNTLYLGGSFNMVNGQTRNRAAAIDIPSGNLLPWNPDFNNEVNRYIFNDTMMIALGRFTSVGGQTRNRIAAVGLGGATVTSWDPNANNEVNTGAIVGNTLYIGGRFTQLGGQTRNRLGAVDLGTGALQAWNPDASSTVEAMLAVGNVLYVGGNFTQIAGQAQARLASFDLPAGSIRSWAPNPSASVYSIGSQGGKLMIGGDFRALQSEDRSRLLALRRASFALHPWAPAPNGIVNQLAIFNDTMMLGGSFRSINGQARDRLAMVTTTSTPTVLPWNPGADGTVETLFIFNDTMMVGGAFSQLAGENRPFLGALSLSRGQALAWNPQPNDDVLAISQSGGTVLAGGMFDTYKGQTRNRLLCLDLNGDSLTAWHPSITGFFFPQAYAIAPTPSGVWVGGTFGTIGDSARQNLALTDSVSGQVLPTRADVDNRVFALEAVGNSLWVGGNFDSIQSQFRSKLAVISSTTGVPLSYQPHANDDTYFLAWNDTMMVAGGDFSHLVGRRRRGGYAVDTKTGQLTAWNPDLGLNGFISTLEVDPKNKQVYLGGSFDELHGQLRENLARVDTDTGRPDGWQADANALVHDLAWDPVQEELYAAGGFTQVGGLNRNYLARIGSNGQVSSFQPNPNGRVFNLAWNDTMMFAAGSFTQIGGVTRNSIAAINRDGRVDDWAPAVGGITGAPADVSGIAMAADRIYIGGNFRQINGQPRNRLAAFDRTTGRLLPWRISVDPTDGSTNIAVNRIKLRDENLFISGVFSEINGTLTDNFAWIDTKSGLVKGLRTQISNLVFDVEVLDSLVYMGGDFIDAEGTYNPNLATYRVGAPIFRDKTLSVEPGLGGNIGDVTVQIYGSDFTTYPKVILRKPGFADIPAIDSLTRVFFGNQLRATFNLRNAPLGLRDVWVIANGDTTILEDGFRVVQGQEPRVWAKVIRPPRIRFNPNSPGHTLLVSYGNAGTVDAEGVPIWLALSSAINLAKIDLEFLPYPNNIPAGDSILPFVPVDTLDGEEVDAVVYCMVIGRIPAGFQGHIAFRVRPDTVGTFFVSAWATEPLFGSPLKYAVGECTDALIGKIVGLVPGGDCLYNGLDALLSPIFDAALDSDFGSAQYAANYAWTLGGAVVDCGIAATGGGLVLDILKDILNYKSLFDDFQTILACIEQFGPDPEESDIRITASADPNQKTGLPGVGAPHWINPGLPLPYWVEFENLPNATAPAIEVRIEDTLNRQVMDLATFELRFFTLADSLFEIPPGRRAWEQMVDLRPNIDAFARVSMALDTLSGIFTSRFEGLDPATLEPLTGALDGIIPPNVNDPEGRGSVAYRVDLLPGLPTGTAVANSAAIYFDFNAPIVTNTWLNTLDIDAPESKVRSLDSVQNTLSFPVSWSGSDRGSGVRSYDLYVSTDGGPFVRELPNLSDTLVTFTGEAGRSYGFYTLAKDSVGNEELAPVGSDAQTFIDRAARVDAPLTAKLRVVPNPNQGNFELNIEGLPAGKAYLRIFDAAGRILVEQPLTLRGGRQRIPVQVALPKGIYLLGLQMGGDYWHQRLVVR